MQSAPPAIDSSKISPHPLKPNRHISQQEDMKLLVTETKFGETLLSDRQVAKKLGVSVPAVFASLKAAYEEGYFTAVVRRPRERAELVGLEHAVKKEYRLKRVLLVHGLVEICDDPDPRRRIALHTRIVRAMAVRVAEYLDGFVDATAKEQRKAAQSGQEVKPALVGVAWGRTMHMIAEHLPSSPRRARAFRRGLEFLPLIGSTNSRNREGVEANVVASDFARAFGGVSAQLPCPAFVKTIDRTTLLGLEQVTRVLRSLPECRVIITSMGPILPEGRDSDMTISDDKVMNAALIASARKVGAIGEIMFGLFDAHGQEVHTGWQVMSLGLHGIQSIAKDPERDAVLVCGGD